MKRLAPWAWLVVLGTALALSWWSMDSLALHFGMPKLLAAMVSATFDGAALVAADLAMKRATVADSAGAVKLVMVGTVGLSAWLNFQHGLLLGYPLAIRVLFAAPSVISGVLFELELRNLHRARLHELDLVAPSLPRFGFLVWLLHPFGAVHRVYQITGSRLRSVPETVMDWQQSVGTAVTVVPLGSPVLKAAVEAAAGDAGDASVEPVAPVVPARRPGRAPVPDEVYLAPLRELVAAHGGMVPSVREVARKLSIGQDRARRLVEVVNGERESTGGAARA